MEINLFGKTWKAANENTNHRNFAAIFVGAGQDSAVRGGASCLGVGGSGGGGPLLECGGEARRASAGAGDGARGPSVQAPLGCRTAVQEGPDVLEVVGVAERRRRDDEHPETHPRGSRGARTARSR